MKDRKDIFVSIGLIWICLFMTLSIWIPISGHFDINNVERFSISIGLGIFSVFIAKVWEKLL